MRGSGSGPTAVVLFNLGGPDSPAAVRPFLQNLFSDPAILRVPAVLRWILARIIARRRAPEAQKIYHQLGGASPLLPNTEAQARALESCLNDGIASDGGYRVFIAMRYWHPFSPEVVEAVKASSCRQMLLLPLYPQFSTTTSGSSIQDWQRAARAAGLDLPTRVVCCYPTLSGFVEEVVTRLQPFLEDPDGANSRVLFSAHGLPKTIVEAGDPYQWQVEQSVAAVVAALKVPGLDWVVCYQSRVGPLEWIGPATEDEIRRAGEEGRGVIVVPIAFVSEHSETLVELDQEYAHLARSCGVPSYRRVATVGEGPRFIEGLAGLVRQAMDAPAGRPVSHEGGRICPAAALCCLQGR